MTCRRKWLLAEMTMNSNKSCWRNCNKRVRNCSQNGLLCVLRVSCVVCSEFISIPHSLCVTVAQAKLSVDKETHGGQSH